MLPAPFLALLLLGGPASPASAQTLLPFSLTTSAHVDVTAAPGQRAVAEWYVLDSGASELAVTMSAASLNAESQQSPALAWVRHIRPVRFKLASGAYRDVQVVVRVPRGTPAGSYFVNVEASAAVPGTGGTISGAVAGTLEVDVP
jgi:uncharacterized membrane protein